MQREAKQRGVPDLSVRHRVPEWMDDPRLDEARHRHALHGLARLNAISRTASVLARAVAGPARRGGERWRLLDVACGGGDVTLALHLRLERAGLRVIVHGCDISDVALAEARQRAAACGADDLHYFHCDVLRDGLPADYDAVTCSLFLHHLDEADAERLLRQMGEQAGLVVVDDLVRSRWNWATVWLSTRLVTRSPVVHVDGPLSIQGAFTVDELAGLASRAGLHGAVIRRRVPARMLLRWVRT